MPVNDTFTTSDDDIFAPVSDPFFDPSVPELAAPVDETPAAEIDVPEVIPPIELEPTVEWGGETVTIGEPTTKEVLRLVQFLASTLLTSQKTIGAELKGMFMNWRNGQSVQDVPILATIAVVGRNMSDAWWKRLAAIAIFGGSDEAIKKVNAQPDEVIKFAPVIRALQLRYLLSDDLRETVKNWQEVGNLFKANSPVVKVKDGSI